LLVELVSSLYYVTSSCIYSLILVHCFTLFFFNVPSTTEIYTLSLHDALPIFLRAHFRGRRGDVSPQIPEAHWDISCRVAGKKYRSEEHTSELQSHLNLVCRLLLEKKKKINILNNDLRLDLLQSLP